MKLLVVDLLAERVAFGEKGVEEIIDIFLATKSYYGHLILMSQEIIVRKKN